MDGGGARFGAPSSPTGNLSQQCHEQQQHCGTPQSTCLRRHSTWLRFCKRAGEGIGRQVLAAGRPAWRAATQRALYTKASHACVLCKPAPRLTHMPKPIPWHSPREHVHDRANRFALLDHAVVNVLHLAVHLWRSAVGQGQREAGALPGSSAVEAPTICAAAQAMPICVGLAHPRLRLPPHAPGWRRRRSRHTQWA